jgi:hypothetical protein
LWAVFVIAVPVPLIIPLRAEVPAARIVMLATISGFTMIAETTRGAVVPLALLLFAQALIAIAVFWLAAYLISRLLARLPDGARAAVTVALAAALLVITSTNSLYRDPYRPETLRSNLLQVYE